MWNKLLLLRLVTTKAQYPWHITDLYFQVSQEVSSHSLHLVPTAHSRSLLEQSIHSQPTNIKLLSIFLPGLDFTVEAPHVSS